MKDLNTVMDELVRQGQKRNQEAIVKALDNLDRETRELVGTVTCECHRCGYEYEAASVRDKILDTVRCPQCGEDATEKKLPPIRQAQMKECACGMEYLIYNDHFGCPVCGEINLPDRNRERALSFLKKEPSE